MAPLTSIGELDRIVAAARGTGRRIVFTNGCFDVLHRGHVEYLEEASRLGDLLIVGLNDDASVARLKGPSRPVNSLEDRAAVLTALSSVDYVIEFKEDTPLELIRRITPDVLVKGGDYRVEEIVGKELVEASGGQVVVLKEVPGKSTTAILRRLAGGNGDRS